MQSIGEILMGMSGSAMKQSYERALKEQQEHPLTDIEWEKRRRESCVDSYDKAEYDCKLCRNRGFIPTIVEEDGRQVLKNYICRCMDIRKSIWRLKKSGLDLAIREKTFDKFIVEQPYQGNMLNKGRVYAEKGIEHGYWFFVGGQPGCGKTHICTAIAREVLYKKALHYVLWNDFARLEGEAIKSQIEEYKTTPVLYIDDFFKPVKDYKGNRQFPGMAEVRLAFEIINYRYIKNLPTIISSEWSIKELDGIDEAIASRIYEKCNSYIVTIQSNKEKNRRYKN